jgi:copper resistance protein C
MTAGPAPLRRRIALLVAAGGLVTAPALLVVGPAQAHNYLVSSTPAEGATLTELPSRFEITTNEALLDLGGNTNAFALQVTDENGLFYGDGCVDVEGPAMSAHASLGAPGTYTVQWQVVSADGHSVSDAFDFRWDPSTPADESRGSATPPICGGTGAPDSTSAAGEGGSGTRSGSVRVEADTETASEGTEAGPNQGASSDTLWIGAAVVAAAAAGGGALLVGSRNRRDPTAGRKP